jgi:AbrB family looped-hinge helix DNA binding protein
MVNKIKNESQASSGFEVSCCKIDAIIAIDNRGQMVLPKEIREKADIKAGDKLAVVSWEKDGKVCCITLMKADDLTGPVKNVLEPVIKDIL